MLNWRHILDDKEHIQYLSCNKNYTYLSFNLDLVTYIDTLLNNGFREK